MGILSTNALIDVSALQLQFTVFGMVSAMIIGRYVKRDWWGFLPTYSAILSYHVWVRMGGDIQNPLDIYTGVDYVDANRVLNIIDPILLLFFCWIGFVLQKVLSNIQLLQLFEKVPYPLRSQAKPVLIARPDGTYTVRSIMQDRNAPERHFGVVGLQQSWLQTVITLVVYLGGVAGPQIVYDQFVTRTGLEATHAFAVNVAVPFCTISLFCLYCRFWHTDPGTFGLTAEWFKANSAEYPLPTDQIAQLDKETKARVVWAIMPSAAAALLGNFALGGWRLIDPNVDRMWLGAVGLFAFWLLVLAIITWTMWNGDGISLLMPGKKVKIIDDRDGRVEQMASPVALVTGAFNAISTRIFGSAAMQNSGAASSNLYNYNPVTQTDRAIEMHRMPSMAMNSHRGF
jgi:hypothetical protein